MAKLDPTKAVVSVDAAMVLRALSFAAVNDIRCYLNGVCIRPAAQGGALIIGCDGHTALVLHDQAGQADKEYILPLSKRAHGRLLGPKSAQKVRVDATGTIYFSNVNRAATTFIHPGQPIDAKFPDVAAPVPPLASLRPGLPAAINPAYLRRALDAGMVGKWQSIRFFFDHERAEQGVVLFTVTDGFGLVMPLRDDVSLERRIPVDFHKTAAAVETAEA